MILHTPAQFSPAAALSSVCGNGVIQAGVATSQHLQSRAARRPLLHSSHIFWGRLAPANTPAARQTKPEYVQSKNTTPTRDRQRREASGHTQWLLVVLHTHGAWCP